MIYLDTSALAHESVVGQQQPLPIWSLVELEFYKIA